MLEILAIADKHRIPIISDEVYYGLSYNEERPFHSMGNMTSTVPVMCTGSLSKIYCVPGWRLGWTIVYNNQGYFDRVIDNMGKHAMIQLHPNSLVQHSLPNILANVPDTFFTELKLKLKTASDAAYTRLQGIKGIKPIQSSAAMYMMVSFDTSCFKDIEDDYDFCRKLLLEMNCMVFPAQCFFAKNAFRIIICTKAETINEFGSRLEKFC